MSRIPPSRGSVAEQLVQAGASPEVADEIVAELGRSGLSPRRMEAWLFDPRLGYLHPQPPREYGGVMVDGLVAGSAWSLANGRQQLVLDSARAFCAASEAERVIAQLLISNVPQVRRLTGGDEDRTEAIAALLTQLRRRVRTPVHVERAAVARSGADGIRLIDRLLRGEEHAVMEELEAGLIDVKALAGSKDRDPTW